MTEASQTPSPREIMAQAMAETGCPVGEVYADAALAALDAAGYTVLPPAQEPDTIDEITLRVNHIAQVFDVNFRAAGIRCVQLGLVSKADWDALLERAKQEIAAHAGA